MNHSAITIFISISINGFGFISDLFQLVECFHDVMASPNLCTYTNLKMIHFTGDIYECEHSSDQKIEMGIIISFLEICSDFHDIVANPNL